MTEWQGNIARMCRHCLGTGVKFVSVKGFKFKPCNRCAGDGGSLFRHIPAPPTGDTP